MTDTVTTPPAPPKPMPTRTPLDTRAFIVGWMMISTFLLLVLCWWKPPAADNQILNTLVGVYAATGFVTAIQWWMGSSKGSEDKSTTIQELAK